MNSQEVTPNPVAPKGAAQPRISIIAQTFAYVNAHAVQNFGQNGSSSGQRGRAGGAGAGAPKGAASRSPRGPSGAGRGGGEAGEKPPVPFCGRGCRGSTPCIPLQLDGPPQQDARTVPFGRGMPPVGGRSRSLWPRHLSGPGRGQRPNTGGAHATRAPFPAVLVPHCIKGKAVATKNRAAGIPGQGHNEPRPGMEAPMGEHHPAAAQRRRGRGPAQAGRSRGHILGPRYSK